MEKKLVESEGHIPFFLLLAFIGGFVDASSFVIFNVFTGHLTGNSILSVIYLANMDLSLLLLSVVSILGFLSGTLFGTWGRIKSTLPLLHAYSLVTVLTLFSIVFALYFFVPEFYSTNLSIFMISLAMGLQNGCFNKVGSISFHSTYITGMTTSCINAFINKGNGESGKKIFLFSILLFICGGGAGALLSVNYHFIGFSFIILPLLIAVIYSLRFSHNTSLQD